MACKLVKAAERDTEHAQYTSAAASPLKEVYIYIYIYRAINMAAFEDTVLERLKSSLLFRRI